MIWICAAGTAVNVQSVVRNRAAAAFWLFRRESGVLREIDHRVDPGGASQVDADANFRIRGENAEGTYELRVLPAEAPGSSGQPIPWEYDIRQNQQIVQAISNQGNPLNGSPGAYQSIRLPDVRSAEFSIASFAIWFQ